MRILIVDDETNIRKSLRIALESMKNSVDEAASASFTVRVKSARERILEFCAALD